MPNPAANPGRKEEKVMITQATYNLNVSYLKSRLDKIRKSENLNYLWEIALELNNNKVLSNAKLQIISNHLYHLKQRRNSKKLASVKEMLIRSIQTIDYNNQYAAPARQ